MKTLKLTMAVLLLAGLISCSSDLAPKTITPTSTEFTSGKLAKYVKVEEGPAELSYAEQDGAIATQYIRLKVTLKKVKKGFEDVDARDISFTRLLAVAVINLVDKNGTKVQDLDIKSEDLLKLKKLLTSEKGTTEEIIFEGKFHNSKDAPKWFEEAVQFTPYLTGDISKDNNEMSSSIEESVDETFSNNNVSSSGSTEWDATLDSYEEYVDKYIALMKKVAKGDMSAMAEYPSMLDKAQEFSNKLEKAKGEMSISQINRYTKITSKMATAMQEQ